VLYSSVRVRLSEAYGSDWGQRKSPKLSSKPPQKRSNNLRQRFDPEAASLEKCRAHILFVNVHKKRPSMGS
jgi:hypothetical protein